MPNALFLLLLALAASPLLSSVAGPAPSADVLFINRFEGSTPQGACLALPPPNYLGAALELQQLQTWNQAFANSFPRQSSPYSVTMPRRKYESIEFSPNAPGAGLSPAGLLEAAAASFSAGAAVLSISDCEGDFSTARLNVGGRICTTQAASKLTLSWSTDAGSNPSACLLVPGQRYFLNITYGVSVLPGQAWCPTGQACVFGLFSRNF